MLGMKQILRRDIRAKRLDLPALLQSQCPCNGKVNECRDAFKCDCVNEHGSIAPAGSIQNNIMVREWFLWENDYILYDLLFECCSGSIIDVLNKQINNS